MEVGHLYITYEIANDKKCECTHTCAMEKL